MDETNIAKAMRSNTKAHDKELAARVGNNAGPIQTTSYEGELYKPDTVEDHRTYHLPPIIVATQITPSQLRLHSNKQPKTISLTCRRIAD